MINKKHLQTLRKGLHDYALVRRDVIKYAGDALHHSKRAVFDMQKGDVKEAKKKLTEAEDLFKKLHKTHKKDTQILQEGSYKAAVEEYVEANLMYQFVTTGELGDIKTFPIEAEVFLAGLCDVPGELYRYAIRAATNSDSKTVYACQSMANEIIGELIEFHLTSYLRTKFDQAKQSTQKLEIVVYEMSLRGK